MPGGMDGLALARRAREEHPGTPVLVTSGVPRMAERAGGLCADGPILEKPYRHEDLAAEVNRLLALAGQRRQAAAGDDGRGARFRRQGGNG